mgnify:CR=1 FL=1
MNLDIVLTKAVQIFDLAHALEGAIIEIDDGGEPVRRVQSLFYVLLEQFEFLNSELNKLNEHVYVCNAVFAINRVQELKDEIEKLKAAKS